MKMLPKKCIATRALRLAAIFGVLFVSTGVLAVEAGTVTHLSGPLLVRKADGTAKVLSQKSIVEQGDTLVSEKDTYARIKFIDKSEVTLRPGTQLKIDKFSYEQDKPENDSAIFSLIKGGLHAITGLLGKRSNTRSVLNTPSATIGIRGTTYIAEYIPEEQPAVAGFGQFSMAALAATHMSDYATMTDAPSVIAPIEFAPARRGPPVLLAQLALPGGTGVPPRSPGLYVQVLDGIINLSNKGGSQSFSAGQFGYTASFIKPPIVLPSNPGMQFTPPPAFSSSSGPQGGSNPSNKSSQVDCEVR